MYVDVPDQMGIQTVYSDRTQVQPRWYVIMNLNQNKSILTRCYPRDIFQAKTQKTRHITKLTSFGQVKLLIVQSVVKRRPSFYYYQLENTKIIR